MIQTFLRQLLAATLSVLLIFPAVPKQALSQQPAPAQQPQPQQPAPIERSAPDSQPQPGQQPAPAPEYQGQGAPLTANELEQLVAPIALYPDALVAQVLAAATFPDQVADANTWLQQNKSLTGTALTKAVDGQQWDPSVKALTQFPSVMDNLAKNLAWTSSLGEAYHTQSADVMKAVQSLRAKAKAAGNLKSGSQITVVQQAPDTIVIQPANPQVVYVPTYNPTVVYGTPYVTPGYSTADVVATAVIAFGVGIAVGAAMGGWGWGAWGCNWYGGGAYYHGSVYYGNTVWRGGAYGSSVTAVGPYGAARAGTAYNPNTGTYARGAAVATPYGTQRAGQAYNPNTGAYAATHQVSNAYGNAGSSVISKNGNTAYTQHASGAAGSVATAETSAGGRAIAGTGAYGNSGAAVQTANGNKYAAADGKTYSNTGNGWHQNVGSTNSAAAHGYGAQEHSGGAFGGGGGNSGWGARQSSARGSFSRGGGGGWGGGGGGFRGRR